MRRGGLGLLAFGPWHSREAGSRSSRDWAQDTAGFIVRQRAFAAQCHVAVFGAGPRAATATAACPCERGRGARDRRGARDPYTQIEGMPFVSVSATHTRYPERRDSRAAESVFSEGFNKTAPLAGRSPQILNITAIQFENLYNRPKDLQGVAFAIA